MCRIIITEQSNNHDYFQIKSISTQTPLPNIVECKQELFKYADKIDKIQVMLDRINSDVKALERNVTTAEEELGYNDTKLRGFFKPFLKKVVGKEVKPNDNQDAKDLAYKPIEIFQLSDYFPGSTNN